MKVAKISRPRYYVELTAEDLRNMVFETIKTHIDRDVDVTRTVYVQVLEGKGIGEEGASDDLEDYSDYQLSSTCRGVQVRFVVETDEDEEEKAVDNLPEPGSVPAKQKA